MFNAFPLEEASTFLYSEHINTNCFISNTFIISMKATFLHFPFWASCANLNIALMACTVRERAHLLVMSSEVSTNLSTQLEMQDCSLLEKLELGLPVIQVSQQTSLTWCICVIMLLVSWAT